MGILLALHVVVTILLILIVLIQKTEGGSSLFATSGSSGMFNARGTSNVLTKTTWVLASIFIINCIVMAKIASSNIDSSNTIIQPEEQADVADNENSQNFPTRIPLKRPVSNKANPAEESSPAQGRSGENTMGEKPAKTAEGQPSSSSKQK
ncbi:MAG: preprotein translocase subunit SecG [Holosporales bacterium]|jgi:preprotein translocase subunit SecG|nr:preprotein translocase subunit SecG [Holosporales bacterium]